MRRIFVDPASPQRDAIEEAATWIRTGGVIALPTDTLYGLAADPFDGAAVRRVFEIKGRGLERALPLIAADLAQVVEHVGGLSPSGGRLAERFWPGPLTLLVAAPAGISRAVTGGTSRVGIRVPAQDIARAVCAVAGRPITATSANVSGEAATEDPDKVEMTLGDRIDLLVDAGMTRGGAPSTIVDLTGPAPKLVRAGAIAWDEIQSWLRHA